jgi:hypothetical protein
MNSEGSYESYLIQHSRTYKNPGVSKNLYRNLDSIRKWSFRIW